jgi:tetratricopeptide (TPR) repeat protein
MKIDRIKHQEANPSVQRLRDMLHTIKTPEKTQEEWSFIEKNIFGDLNSSEYPQEQPSTRLWTRLFGNFLRPAGLIPGFAAAILLVAAAISFVTIKTEAPFVRAIDVNGKVVVRPHSRAIADTIRGNDALNAFSRIAKNFSLSTLDKSTFIFQIGKECAFELSPNSQLTIMDLSESSMVFNLSQGTLLAKVTKRDKNQKFNVFTPSAVCRITGTIFKVDVFPAKGGTAKQTVLTVYEGNVVFESSNCPRKQNLVAAGRSCSALPGGEPYRVSESETPIKAISTLELLVNAKYLTPQASGLLDVSSLPEEAMVMLDDTIVGSTPLVLRKPVGKHRIKLSSWGYSPWEQQISIGPDSITTLRATLASASERGGKGHGEPATRKLKKRAHHALISDPESLLVAFPDYVEANIQLSIGEYQKALGILDSLKNNHPLDMRNRKSIMNKINSCYAKLGDFAGVLSSLQEKLDLASTSSTPQEKEQLLWEIANLNANCIGDYEGAELALADLIELGASGYRTCEAYEKLAEAQYMLGKSDSAVATFETLLRKYPGAPARERALFSLASICDDDMRHLKDAIGIYSKVMNDFPQGNYYKAALFARAECFDRLGRVAEAQSDYKQCLAIDPRGIWNAACAQRLRTGK